VNLVPGWRREMRLGRRREGLGRYVYQGMEGEGQGYRERERESEAGLAMPFMPEMGGGVCLPQVYCKSVGGSRMDRGGGGGGGKGSVFFTDDVIFGVHKKGLFQLLVSLDTLSRLQGAMEMVADVKTALVAGIEDEDICLGEPTYLVQDTGPGTPTGMPSSGTVYQLASAEEFAASPLCEGRPAPQGYDPLYLAKAVGSGMRFVIVRPDRFIFASCTDSKELERAVRAVVGYLRGC
jgi:hypothetical protein